MNETIASLDVGLAIESPSGVCSSPQKLRSCVLRRMVASFVYLAFSEEAAMPQNRTVIYRRRCLRWPALPLGREKRTTLRASSSSALGVAITRLARPNIEAMGASDTSTVSVSP